MAVWDWPITADGANCIWHCWVVAGGACLGLIKNRWWSHLHQTTEQNLLSVISEDRLQPVVANQYRIATCNTQAKWENQFYQKSWWKQFETSGMRKATLSEKLVEAPWALNSEACSLSPGCCIAHPSNMSKPTLSEKLVEAAWTLKLAAWSLQLDYSMAHQGKMRKPTLSEKLLEAAWALRPEAWLQHASPRQNEKTRLNHKNWWQHPELWSLRLDYSMVHPGKMMKHTWSEQVGGSTLNPEASSMKPEVWGLQLIPPDIPWRCLIAACPTKAKWENLTLSEKLMGAPWSLKPEACLQHGPQWLQPAADVVQGQLLLPGHGSEAQEIREGVSMIMAHIGGQRRQPQNERDCLKSVYGRNTSSSSPNPVTSMSSSVACLLSMPRGSSTLEKKHSPTPLKNNCCNFLF